MAVRVPSTYGRRVFVDSSAYLALRDSDDEHHAEAVAILTRLAQDRYRLYSTNALLFEAHALILSTLGISQGQAFLREMEQSNLAFIRVRERDELLAKQIIYHYADKDFSFVDAISFIIMERLHIQLAFTFDHHFRQYGFTQLTPDLL